MFQRSFNLVLLQKIGFYNCSYHFCNTVKNVLFAKNKWLENNWCNLNHKTFCKKLILSGSGALAYVPAGLISD